MVMVAQMLKDPQEQKPMAMSEGRLPERVIVMLMDQPKDQPMEKEKLKVEQVTEHWAYHIS
jgi:hypothetical protein